jgi:hypothetical protein
MSTRDRKRELKASWRTQVRTRLEASLPLPKADLRALFQHLDGSAIPCNHSLHLTSEYLRGRGIEPDNVVPWLHQHGGYCDCEVLSNVADQFGLITGYASDV